MRVVMTLTMLYMLDNTLLHVTYLSVILVIIALFVCVFSFYRFALNKV